MLRIFWLGLLFLFVGIFPLIQHGIGLCLGATATARDVSMRCIEGERQALLSFKQGLVDEYGHLSSWTTKQDCCKWRGIKCSNKTGHVIMLNLQVTSWTHYYEPFRGNIRPSLLELQHLQYLDLSQNDFGGIQIPKFLCSLRELRHLDLSHANFSGSLPYELGNLTSLIYLNLGYEQSNLKATTLLWLTQLTSLRHLDLSGIDLANATDWVQSVSVNPSLKHMLLSGCQLSSIFPPHISFSNSSISFVSLDLSYNDLNASIYPLLLESSSSLVHLDLSANSWGLGVLPSGFGSMSFLNYLDISDSYLEGGIPKFTENECSLKSLFLGGNKLNVELSELMQNLSECISLESLDLRDNRLTGSFGDITSFSSLRELYVSYNSLNGSFPKNFEQFSVLTSLSMKHNQIMGPMLELKAFPLLETLDLNHNQLSGTLTNIKHLSRLKYLDISSNYFNGTLSGADMLNLTKLRYMDLSMNLLVLNISSDWVPPFQLDIIRLKSCCKSVYAFPNWLLTQTNYSVLDISGIGIAGRLPPRFWNLSPRLVYLNVSNNGIRGNVPNLSSKFSSYCTFIDLSENNFEGPIPFLPSNVYVLDLSSNKFSGQISILCGICGPNLTVLNLSNNKFSGGIPDCWAGSQYLFVLNLGNNQLSGQIPNSLGSLVSIQQLHLGNNKLSGELPSSLKNCTNLNSLYVGENSLTGGIPTWIGENLSDLIILSLRSNAFYGGIPLQLCNLSSLQILDLSINRISGTIPKCFGNLTMMQVQNNESQIVEGTRPFLSIPIEMGGWDMPRYLASTWLVWKGSERFYENTLGLVKLMDLSVNELTGEIPNEIAVLKGLKVLNLSRNYLAGVIFKQIGQMNQLESLDLSGNMLVGEIPLALSQLSFLGFLNLSNNKLSGKIPEGTQLQSFNASAYMGNLGLCGRPLPRMCPGDEFVSGNKSKSTREEMDDHANIWFHVSICLGFVSGFCIICGTLLLKESWRDACYNLLVKIKDNIYVTLAISAARFHRKFHS